MSEVILHRLAGSKKALEVCRLVEQLYRSGKRVVVWIADGSRAGVLDEYLWTFAQSSFVPHALWDGSAELDDPVVIVSGTLANPNNAAALVVGDRLPDPAAARGWPEVHDLAGAAAEDAGKREAWEAAGFAVTETRGIGAEAPG
ncbi:MAG: DNA polymerase III subunit chi [Thermoanaerobaculaceae bacterium]|nr:DNA polymerase III subunit chi [Thermoanaerobaculaceae bacterium]